MLLVGAIASTILILFVGGVILMQGRVHGTEFSPTHFQTRSFSFHEIPLLHLQLTPIRRSAATAAASSYLRANNLIRVPPGTSTQWHLVRITRGMGPATPADSHILVKYLNLDRSQSAYWKQWSVDHPELAKALWPRIQRLAQRELYVLMPDLFELAVRAPSSTEVFTKQLDRLIRESTLRLAADMTEAGRVELARALLTEALTDFPNDPELQAASDALPPPPDDIPGQ
ncbi:MAG: hypothetical protein WD119_02335 [Pirellulaceae bacterium]